MTAKRSTKKSDAEASEPKRGKDWFDPNKGEVVTAGLRSVRTPEADAPTTDVSTGDQPSA